MKQLRYLSIQGHNAPAYWFKNYDAHNFKSTVESITLSQALLISSIYRTDFFYYSDNPEDQSIILRAWCAFKRLDYSSTNLDKFVRADTRGESFQIYFDTLFHLMHHPAHLARYKERFKELVQIDPRNIILRDLMACDLHLSERYKKEELDHVSLSDPVAKAAFLPCRHFSLIADKGLADMIYN
ncbi:hypothetical protein [Marinoscillum sp.]|uniref:hypothetical protein n=1 Tax=Marinoscillum sp. TaxID=2024838 RepID=UPI003BABE6B8